jgi:hypothetical protein
MTAAEIEELSDLQVSGPSPIPDYAPFQRVLRQREECAAVGSYDGRKEARAELSAPRVFEEFSIRLPPGFIVFPKKEDQGGRVYLFARLHNDLDKSTVMTIAVRPFTAARADLTEKEREQAAESYQSDMLAALRKRRDAWTQANAVTETIAGHRFKLVRWSGLLKGEPMEGIQYVGITGSRVFVIGTQDFAGWSSDTLPLMRASIDTLLPR